MRYEFCLLYVYCAVYTPAPITRRAEYSSRNILEGKWGKEYVQHSGKKTRMAILLCMVSTRIQHGGRRKDAQFHRSRTCEYKLISSRRVFRRSRGRMKPSVRVTRCNMPASVQTHETRAHKDITTTGQEGRSGRLPGDRCDFFARVGQIGRTSAARAVDPINRKNA